MILTSGLALKGLLEVGKVTLGMVAAKRHKAFISDMVEKGLETQVALQERQWELRKELQEKQIQETRAAAKLVADQKLAIFEEQSFLEFWPLLDSPVKLRRDFSKALENGNSIPLQIIIPSDTRVLGSGGNDLQEAMVAALTDLATFMSSNYAHREGNQAAAKVYTNCVKHPQQGYGTSQLHSIYEVFHLAPTLILNPYCQGDRFCIYCSYWDGSDLEKQWTPAFYGPVFSCSLSEFRSSYLAEKVERWKKIRHCQAMEDANMDALATLLENEAEACEAARRSGVGEEEIQEFVKPRFAADLARFCEPYTAKIRAYIGGVVSDACRLCTSLFTDLHYLVGDGLEPQFPRLCASGLERFNGCAEQADQLFSQAVEARKGDPLHETQAPLWHALLAHAYQGTPMEAYADDHRQQSTSLLRQLLPAPKDDVRWIDVPEMQQTVDTLYSLPDDGADSYVRECFDFLHTDAATLFSMGEAAAAEGKDAKALDFYTHSAAQGHAPAMHMLAECHRLGRGTKADPATAVDWYRKAADKGYAPAQFALGSCYDNGTGVPMNKYLAVEWYGKAAAQGMLQAQSLLGAYYYKGEGVVKNDTEAVKWFGLAAAQGDTDSQYGLALCLFNGTGTPKDEAKAVEWLHQAATQGHADAQCRLGTCCAEGCGTPVDKAAAAEWYRQAADNGNTEACYLLGKHLADGQGGLPQLDIAAGLFRQAAEQGHTAAMYEYALCQLDGFGTSCSEAGAIAMFRKSAELGHVDSIHMLGVCYMEGVGVPENETQAVDMFRKAAELGHAEAQYKLGKYYWDKYLAAKAKTAQPAAEPQPAGPPPLPGTPAAPAKKNKLFGFSVPSLSAITEKLTSSTLYAVANSTLSSLGIKLDHDLDNAQKWFQMAADQGHEEAAKALDEIKAAKAQAASS